MITNLNTITLINFLLITALTSFFISRKKILMSLLSLEFILLNMFLSMMMMLSLTQINVSSSIFMLVLGACEASLGLSLVINMTRFKGNDMLNKSYTKF